MAPTGGQTWQVTIADKQQLCPQAVSMGGVGSPACWHMLLPQVTHSRRKLYQPCSSLEATAPDVVLGVDGSGPAQPQGAVLPVDPIQKQSHTGHPIIRRPGTL